MPPDGHTTVTLPDELVDELDSMAQALGASSRADAIEMLLSDYDPRVSAYVTEIDGGVVDDLTSQIAAKTAEELQGRLR